MSRYVLDEVQLAGALAHMIDIAKGGPQWNPEHCFMCREAQRFAEDLAKKAASTAWDGGSSPPEGDAK